jgi:putative nucleotidyltransferase with HDIG domain
MKDEPPSSGRLRAAAIRARAGFARSSRRILSADRWWSLGFVAVLLGLFADLAPPPGVGLRAGDPAPSDLRAPRDLQVVDEEQTAALEREARAAVPEVYVYDRNQGDRLAADLARLLARVREGDAPEVVPREALPALRDPAASGPVAETLTGAVRRAMNQKVVSNRARLLMEPSVLLREIPGTGGDERVTDYGAYLGLPDAQRSVQAYVLEMLPPRVSGRGSFVDANVMPDPRGTQARRAQAAAAVRKVQRTVPRGELLVKAGDPVPEEVVAALSKGRLTGPGVAPFFGLLTVLGLVAFFIHRYTRYHQRNFTRLPHLNALFVLLMLCLLLLTKGFLWLAHGLTDNLGPPYSAPDLYLYLFPVAAGAIIVALLANGRIATVYSAFTALLFGMLADWDMFRATWVLLVQWVGVYAISTYRDRAALLRAGLIVGGAGAVLVVALHGVEGSAVSTGGVLYGALLAFLGGAVGVGLLVSFLLPVLERLFGVLTDVRLLELSDANHPLLRELAERAPGTWTHSQSVGALAEEAARAVGANPLFCRVAALYHDVGKVKKPEYYVENQRGANPHDRLAPSMSALVIAAHVKDGIRMAREAGIPEQIVDVIPQHHGTRLMTYFYEKARRLAEPGDPPPKEEDFRYPGPKPQTRETAIFMLADGIEAAARTAEDANPGRLREVIRQLTSAIVLDGQLDECNLTFSDLERIQGAMLRTLVSTRHQRVHYPGFDFNRRRGDAPVRSS